MTRRLFSSSSVSLRIAQAPTCAIQAVGVVALSWGAVRPEERYLSAAFGAEYDAYRAGVRRWL